MSSVTEQTLVHAVVRKIHTPSNRLLAKKGLTSNMLGQGTGTEIMAAILLGHAQSSVACCDKRTTDIESAHETLCKIKNRNEMNVNPASLAFRTKLLSISNSITQKEFSDLKFVCKEHIPVGILERFTTPLELFNQLEKHNLLAADNKDFLGVLLIGINRNELRDELFDEKGDLC